MTAITVATYVLLGLAVLGLWTRQLVWVALLIAAVVAGYAGGVLVQPAALWIALLAIACLAYTQVRSGAHIRARLGMALSVVAIVMLSVLLGLHSLPGFHNALVAKDLVLTPGAAPYTLYLNFDKTAAGILIVGICCRAQLARGWRDFTRTLARAAPIVGINTVVLVVLSVALGYLRFDPKWTPFFWIWAPVNLFFTCLSEEAFFRGFIQQGLQDAFVGFRHGAAVALVASALLFGLAHFGGGWTYVALAAVAGLGYGFAFQRTGRLEASITAHFTLNALHFLLFTYPRAT